MAATGADKARARELLEKGATLYEDGNLHDALACWKEVLLLDPGNPIAEEYLRFIRESFQIDIDAFLAHQDPPRLCALLCRRPSLCRRARQRRLPPGCAPRT